MYIMGLVSLLLSWVKPLFGGVFASVISMLSRVLPDEIMNLVLSNHKLLAIIGLAIPAYLVYSYLAE